MSELLNILTQLDKKLSELEVPELNLEHKEFTEILLRARVVYAGSARALRIALKDPLEDMSEAESVRYLSVINAMQTKGVEILHATNGYISKLAKVIARDSRIDVSEQDVLDMTKVFIKGSPEGLDNHLRKLRRLIDQTTSPRTLH